MGDTGTKYRHSQKRKRNFIAKKLREDQQFRRKIHIDEKAKQKERRFSKQEIRVQSYDYIEEADST